MCLWTVLRDKIILHVILEQQYVTTVRALVIKLIFQRETIQFIWEFSEWETFKNMWMKELDM